MEILTSCNYHFLICLPVHPKNYLSCFFFPPWTILETKEQSHIKSPQLNSSRLTEKNTINFPFDKVRYSFVHLEVFPILYYNSEIWHLPSLKQSLKQKIISSSAGVLKACMKFNSRMISFERIHTMNNRATPEKILLYKHSLALYRLYNNNDPTMEWCALNFNQVLTSRQTKFKCKKSNKLKVGLNALRNRFFILNNQIPISWLEGGYETFKVKCKELFLNMWNLYQKFID